MKPWVIYVVIGPSVLLTVGQQENSWLCFGHGGKFSFRRALSGIRCSSSPQGDGKAKLQNALIGQIARTMSYSTAFGNKTEGRSEKVFGLQLKHPTP